MRQTFLILLLSFCFHTLRGQRANQEYRFTTEFSQYIFGNFPISVEKIYNKRAALGLDAAVRFATKKSGTFKNGEFLSMGNQTVFDYTAQNTFNRFYNAYTLGFHFKWYFRDYRTFYFEPYFQYRYWWFNEKDVRFLPETQFDGQTWGYNYDGIRSEVQRDYVLGVNFGRSIKIKQTRTRKYVIDFKIGVGIVDRSYEFTTHAGRVNGDPVTDYKERGIGKHPVVNLGLSFGFEH